MSEVLREVADIAIATAKRYGAEAERAAIVAWLRKRAKIGPWLPVQQELEWHADRIENLEHLSPMGEGR